MKQSLFAIGLVAAGMLAPQTSLAQQQCIIVCNPPRLFCFPAGTQPPSLISYCRTAGSNSVTAPASESLASDLVVPDQNSCTAQEVFNEDTQAVEWQMVCD